MASECFGAWVDEWRADGSEIQLRKAAHTLKAASAASQPSVCAEGLRRKEGGSLVSDGVGVHGRWWLWAEGYLLRVAINAWCGASPGGAT